MRSSKKLLSKLALGLILGGVAGITLSFVYLRVGGT